MERLFVLVRGINDVGSAVAHRLFNDGHAVAIHDMPAPTTTRRRMAFADALFDGAAELEGVRAVRIYRANDMTKLLEAHEVLPVFAGRLAPLRAALGWEVIIDARMRKRSRGEDQRALAPLTIGLGPGFVAGEHVDVAIETSWESLGAIVDEGPTLPLRGEPRPLGGHGRDRYVYAPVAGRFATERAIGERVEAGTVLAHVAGTPLAAPLGGAIRGLVRDGVRIRRGTKAIEIDPRGADAEVTGIGERPRAIANAVKQAIETRWPSIRERAPHARGPATP